MIRPYVVGADRKARGGGGERVGGGIGWVSGQSGSEFGRSEHLLTGLLQCFFLVFFMFLIVLPGS